MTATLSISERLARMRQTPAVAPAEDLAVEQPPAATPAPRQPTYAEVTGRAERSPSAAAPATPASSSPAMFDRMRRFAARPASVGPRASKYDVPETELQMEWSDPFRPAGSVFSAQEWEAARLESGFDRAVVFEVHKATERGLVALDASTLDPVHTIFLSGALLIDVRLGNHPAWHNANARMECHTADIGTWCYRVVHSVQSIEAQPGLLGAKLVQGEPPAAGAIHGSRPRG